MAAVVMAIATFTSCRRSFICTCTTPATATDPTGVAHTYNLSDMKRKEAKTACNEAGSFIPEGATCVIKEDIY